MNTAKGLHLEQKQLLSQAVFRIIDSSHPYALLSGPSFAKEMMEDLPTAVVVASSHLPNAIAVQKLLSSPRFHIDTSSDLLGVELVGALKNTLAIGAGF